MNQQAYEAGKAAYKQGDFLQAVAQLSQAKFPGEVSGEIDHLLGNCLMKLGRFDEAAVAYGEAAADSSYGHAGALACNRGRALLAANKPQEAIAALNLATQDPDYPTPYKAHVALGKAYTRIGNVREAGVAYRNAAIDESNPDPSSALRNLGGCFMQMGRAVDAVEAYRTALDFSTPLADQNVIFADLGLAYVAANRMGEAVDAFNHATADGNLTLVDGYRELNVSNYGTDYFGLSDNISYEDYLKLTDRERDYFKLEYKCISAYTSPAGSLNRQVALNERITSEDYDHMSDEEKAHWELGGFCTIYAGRLLNTLQRADFVGVFGSRMVMQGAQDRVPEVVDYTNYTINRVGELSLNSSVHSPATWISMMPSAPQTSPIHHISLKVPARPISSGRRLTWESASATTVLP